MISVLLIGLTACATQLVEIRISKNTENESSNIEPIKKEFKSEPSLKSEPPTLLTPNAKSETRTEIKNELENDIKANVKSIRQLNSKNEKPIHNCPKFELPVVIPTPPIPQDIQNKKAMSDEELIVLLTEYARQLRKISLENQAAIRTKMKQYNEMCKK